MMGGVLLKWLGMAVLFATLCSSNPALASSAQIVFAADSLEAEGGRLDGNLVALLQENVDEEAALSDSGFTLQAEHLHIEVDYADPVLRAEALPAGNIIPNPESEPPRDYEAASVVGVENRLGYRWALRPVGEGARIELEAPCYSNESPAKGNVSRESYLNPEHDFSTDLAAAVRVSPCHAGNVSVNGDFCLNLWEWDVEVNANGASEVLRSGSRPSQVAPAGGDYLREMREVFLCAEGARLTMPLQPGTHELYVEGASVEGASLLALRAARGNVRVGSHAVSLDGDDVDLHGARLGAEVSQSGDGVLVRVQGDVDSMRVEGGQLFVAPDGGLLSGPLAFLLWVALLCAALGFAGFRVAFWRRPLRRYVLAVHAEQYNAARRPEGSRQRRSAGFYLLGEERILAEDPKAALRHARRAERLWPGFTEAQALVGFAFHQQRHHDAALQIYQEVYPKLGGSDAYQIAIAAARAHIAEDRIPAAVAWAKEAAVKDPYLFAREIQKPDYAALDEDPWAFAIRRAAPGFARRGFQDPAFA